MSVLVLYGSVYGTTKKYAVELANRISTKSYSFDDNYPMDDYNTIIYLGGLYAGGVKGLKKTLPTIKDICKQLIIVTVGLADPDNEENTKNIRTSLRNQIPEDVLDKSVIFHLRGGMDYDRLNFIHGTMMKLLYLKAKRLPAEKQTPEIKTMIETYGGVVNFVNYDTLDKVIDSIRL